MGIFVDNDEDGIRPCRTTGEQETQTTSEGETGVNLMEYPLKQLARQRLIEKKSQEIPDEQVCTKHHLGEKTKTSNLILSLTSISYGRIFV